ncbi:MAG: 50S ribosomal protein L16 [Bacteroidia bacterium]|nr:MAG: 50S ribosomal protein L16 [Bacteroidia bacterium]
MLQPKRTKFRRMQKGRMKGNAQRGNQLAFGSFGIKSLESKWITGRQIEAARVAVTRYMQRQGQIWIRGRIIFEADGVPFAVAKEALRLAAQKLPVTTRFVVRRDYVENSKE